MLVRILLVFVQAVHQQVVLADIVASLLPKPVFISTVVLVLGPSKLRRILPNTVLWCLRRLHHFFN